MSMMTLNCKKKIKMQNKKTLIIDWEKSFVNHISDEGLASKELSKFNNKKTKDLTH